MHIRRTDKIVEAEYQTECAYADQLAIMCGTRCDDLNVFIATDDMDVVDGVRSCDSAQRHNWQLHNMDGDPGRGDGRANLYRLYAEMTLMVRAEWVVATFSSNVGRTVQLMRDQPPETMASLDTDWSAGPWG